MLPYKKVKLKTIRKKANDLDEQYLIKRTRLVLDQFNQKPTNKNLMVLVGKIKAICVAAMSNKEFEEKYLTGYHLEIKRLMSDDPSKDQFDWWPDK